MLQNLRSCFLVGHGNERFESPSLLRARLGCTKGISLDSFQLIPLLYSIMEPDPFNDLRIIIDYAQRKNIRFVHIPLCLFMIRDYYYRNPDINPRRWRVTRIVKLKDKTSKYKHEFIVAYLQLGDVRRYLSVERMMEKSGESGLRISGLLNGAQIFSKDDPADRPGNVTLMSLVPSAAAQMSLPDVLVLATSVHDIAPYMPFGTNCFWFADAMVKVLVQHHGFIIIWERGHPQSKLSKLKELFFHRSVATEKETKDIYADYTITQGRFFDFQQPLYGA